MVSFIDEVRLTLESGRGGDGFVAFRREKYVEFGGPSGGDGGNGGDVFAEATSHDRSLLFLRGKKLLKAPDGVDGGTKKKTGARGEDLILRLPVGTVIRDAESGRVIADLSTAGERVIILSGGRGGRGNAEFRSSTNQTPRYREMGEPGRAREVLIELKLIADVGLVGLPNAGKSTLLSRLSKARPRIADYPFTTLEPQLGVISEKGVEFVMADLPGIIEGAHFGKGLGLKFLRHIERTRLLLHLVDATSEDPMEDYRVIRDELYAYGHDLADKPTMVVFTKMDAAPENELPIESAFGISAVSGHNVDRLVVEVGRRLAELPPVKVYPTEFVHEEEEPAPISVYKDGDRFIVEGDAVRRYLERRAPEDFDSWRRFWDTLVRWGIADELKKLGIKEHDTVLVADREFEYSE